MHAFAHTSVPHVVNPPIKTIPWVPKRAQYSQSSIHTQTQYSQSCHECSFHWNAGQMLGGNCTVHLALENQAP